MTDTKAIQRYADPSNDPRLKHRRGGERDFFKSFAICARGGWLTLSDVFRHVGDATLPIQWICEAAYLEGRNDEAAERERWREEIGKLVERLDELKSHADRVRGRRQHFCDGYKELDSVIDRAGFIAAELRKLIEGKG